MNVANFQPELKYDNVHVYELDHDPLTTTYLIWVKDRSEIAFPCKPHGDGICIGRGRRNDFRRSR